MDLSKPKTDNLLSGWFEGRVHKYPLQIFYEDTDFSGVVYHANYLRFFERARSCFLKLVGINHAELWDQQNIAFAIKSMTIDYHSPAKIDDQLEIRTTYDDLKGARLKITQSCMRGSDILVSASCEAACIAASGRPIRAPEHLKTSLAPYLK